MLPVRWRLSFWFSFLLGLALCGMGLLTYTVLSHQLTGEADERLHQLALQVHRELNLPQQENLDLLSIAPSRLVPASSEFAAPGLYVQILDGKGKVVATSPNLRGEQLPIEPYMILEGLRGRTNEDTLAILTGDEVRVRTIPMIHGDSVIGLIQVGQSLHHVNQTLQWLAVLLGSGVLGVWLLATLVGWVMAGRALRPVSAITGTAASIAATGDFGARISYSGPQDEVGQLASTFNRMINRLETIFESQQQFIADSSHELGTPIAVIRGNADLLSRPLQADQAREAIEAIRAESERMERIVTDLLNIAELDLARESPTQPVRLDLLARAVFTHMRPVAAHVGFTIPEIEPVTVPGSPDWLRELMMNLVDNAIKYTPQGGQVELSVRRRKSWAELVVSDTGIGIPPEALERIFDRFYRVDKTRSRAGGGTGLGLAIVKAIVDAHGGRVSVSSAPGQGTTFLVRLPMAAVPAVGQAKRA